MGQGVTRHPRPATAFLVQLGGMLASETMARVVRVEALGERLSALRLCEAGAVARMQQSLSSVGQLASVAVFEPERGKLEVVDGFKRLRAAKALGWSELRTVAAHP